jgi:hypothetical protein
MAPRGCGCGDDYCLGFGEEWQADEVMLHPLVGVDASLSFRKSKQQPGR